MKYQWLDEVNMHYCWLHQNPDVTQELPINLYQWTIAKQVFNWKNSGVVIHPEVALKIAEYNAASCNPCISLFADVGTITKGIIDEINLLLSLEEHEEYCNQLLALHEYITQSKAYE